MCPLRPGVTIPKKDTWTAFFVMRDNWSGVSSACSMNWSGFRPAAKARPLLCPKSRRLICTSQRVGTDVFPSFRDGALIAIIKPNPLTRELGILHGFSQLSSARCAFWVDRRPALNVPPCLLQVHQAGVVLGYLSCLTNAKGAVRGLIFHHRSKWMTRLATVRFPPRTTSAEERSD